MTLRAVMIFSAGFGTRMGELTRHMPKPLIEVAGTPLIDRALALANAAGVSRKIINTHYFADKIEGHLAGRTGLAFSREDPEPLETGGGLKHALALIHDEAVFTLNPDAVWTGKNPLRALAGHWNPDQMDALLMLVPTEQATGHAGAGDFVLDDDNRLRRATNEGGPALVYTGAQIIKTAPVAATQETRFSLNPVWDRLIARGRVFGCVHQGGWADVGTPAGITLAQTMLETQTMQESSRDV